MRQSMRISLLALFAVAAAALTGGPAQAGGRGHDQGRDGHVRTVVIDHKARHHRPRWDRGHGPRRKVVVVHRHRPATRVIVHEVAPRRHYRHHDPLGHLLGRLLSGTVAQTLETGRSGRTVAWTDPDTRGRASVTPVRTYRTASGQYCREFTTTGNIGGYEEDLYGTACRMPDGSWQRVE